MAAFVFRVRKNKQSVFCHVSLCILQLIEDYEVCLDCASSKPVELAPGDCCGQSCRPCVLDIYEAELKLWKQNCWKRHGGGKDEVP